MEWWAKREAHFRRTTTHSKSPTVSFSAAATSCARDKIISSQFSRSRSDGRSVQNGRLGDLGVQLCFKKYFRFLLTQIIGLSPAIPSRERDVGHRHERWGGMRWTRQRRACNCGRRAVFRERSRRADERCCFRLHQCFGGCAHAAEGLLAKTGRGRQKRVVLAPVAGAKSAEVLRAQPGLATPLIRR
jgi:hypothetical protein